jgi:preprotein translocase subunit YajC
MSTFLDAVAALVPPVAVGGIFWFAMRAIIRADRRERAAMARMAAASRAPESHRE